jgi:hypothetical protein
MKIIDLLVGELDCTRVTVAQIVHSIVVHRGILTYSGGVPKAPQQEILYLK